MSIGRAWTRVGVRAVSGGVSLSGLSLDDFDACVRYLRGQKPDGEEWLPSRLDLVGDVYSITSRKKMRG